jgi:precorrin-2 dehydrogenase/sirohydrochlorin ferrochelatase
MELLGHDFTDETVLVVGGGSVGARKARHFSTARVVVVSPAFADAAFGDAHRIRAAPSPEDADAWLDRTDPALVVAATDDPAVNAAFERAAHDRGILSNRADRRGERERGSVVVPATVEDGPVTVAISTGGQSPALARELRQRIEADIAGVGGLATFLGALRPALEAHGVPAARRRSVARSLATSDAVWKAFESPGQTPDNVIREAVGVDDEAVGAAIADALRGVAVDR